MIALAASLFVAAWLWWSGLEVAAAPRAAAAAFAAATLLLFAAYLRAGRRLGFARAALRSALWTGLASATLLVSALAFDPVVDRIGPWLSFFTAPTRPLAGSLALFGVPAAAGDGVVSVADWNRSPAHAVHWQQLGILPAFALLVVLLVAGAPRVRRGGSAALVAAAAVLLAIPLRFVLVTRVFDDLGWLGVHWHPAAVALAFLPAAFAATALRPLRSLAGLRVAADPRAALPAAMVALAAGLAAFGIAAEPSGAPAGGRVLIDDAHCDWAWTTIPFDRTTYGRQSTYSYVSWLDFLSHYWQADTNASLPLLDPLLSQYDVLVLKTPTAPFEEREREAIERFVRKGGGLFLIGDHTNLFGMTTYLNPIAQTFGIEYQADDTYDLVTGGQTRFATTRLAAHPVVAHMPPMTFETSCSLRPSLALRPVIVGRGIGSEPVDYSHVNFFGNIQPDPDESWGVFLQAAARPYGQGRVLAFTDSTVFSNFSVFYRGIRELGLGAIAYLDRKPGSSEPLLRTVPCLVAVLLVAGAAARVWRSGARGAVLTPALGAVALAAIAGSVLAARYNAADLALPAPRAPLAQVAFDLEHSSYRLPTLIESSVADPQRCFDTFFVSLQRLHLFPRVLEPGRGPDGDDRAFVVLNPVVPPTANELDRIYAWVKNGGRLLVMEPLAGGPHLAANRLLEQAGLRITAAFGEAAAGGLAIYGGEPVTWDPSPALVDPSTKQPLAAPRVSRARVGRGTVIALLGSESFSLQAMGPVFNDPNPVERAVYERQYALFEKVVLEEGWPHDCSLARIIGEKRDKLVHHAPEPDRPGEEAGAMP